MMTKAAKRNKGIVVCALRRKMKERGMVVEDREREREEKKWRGMNGK